MISVFLFSALFFLFGASMYMGTMWVLKLFLYPTWRGLDRSNVGTHFGIPTMAATRFFTLVVPIMFVAGVVLVVTEWGDAQIWLPLVGLAGVVFLTFVGQEIIIPINRRIRGGDFTDDDELRSLLLRWMLLNDLRFYGSTVTWVAIVWYIVSKAAMWEAFP